MAMEQAAAVKPHKKRDAICFGHSVRMPGPIADPIFAADRWPGLPRDRESLFHFPVRVAMKRMGIEFELADGNLGDFTDENAALGVVALKVYIDCPVPHDRHHATRRSCAKALFWVTVAK